MNDSRGMLYHTYPNSETDLVRNNFTTIFIFLYINEFIFLSMLISLMETYVLGVFFNI